MERSKDVTISELHYSYPLLTWTYFACQILPKSFFFFATFAKLTFYLSIAAKQWRVKYSFRHIQHEFFPLCDTSLLMPPLIFSQLNPATLTLHFKEH